MTASFAVAKKATRWHESFPNIPVIRATFSLLRVLSRSEDEVDTQLNG